MIKILKNSSSGTAKKQQSSATEELLIFPRQGYFMYWAVGLFGFDLSGFSLTRVTVPVGCPCLLGLVPLLKTIEVKLWTLEMAHRSFNLGHHNYPPLKVRQTMDRRYKT